MAALDTLTTDKSIEEFKALYLKCVVRGAYIYRL